MCGRVCLKVVKVLQNQLVRSFIHSLQCHCCTAVASLIHSSTHNSFFSVHQPVLPPYLFSVHQPVLLPYLFKSSSGSHNI